ncbi:MAG: hypothetical protein GFH27_549287n320 [Chloroflexi bacterium AL-W]|nr:hypothetical protein [Chloroflexi bacterium AL-N1]NOK66594.1 hypothetical protein [Chloroflexi bacterium AL-N10]NOK71982.1 hypothetical protein [Chloroflexi bacterium AL-N5]NOK81239.1 hypothetical protein [Chloroflexi bacterium AL-W]NOK89512.1 hypothetical protein [Chloroflexi bacterium AL-N15]
MELVRNHKLAYYRTSWQTTMMTSTSHSRKRTRWKGNVIATAFIIIIIGVAQFIAPPTYNWTQNTVSELAAQGYEHKWLMQIGFIGFGLMLSITALSNLRWHIFAFLREIPLAVYALGIGLSGIFCTAPFRDGVLFSSAEAQLHSNFATLAGAAFSITLTAHMFTDSSMRRKWLHLIALVCTITIAIIFGMSEQNIGIIQRSLYLVGFTWIIFVYNSALLTDKSYSQTRYRRHPST